MLWWGLLNFFACDGGYFLFIEETSRSWFLVLMKCISETFIAICLRAYFVWILRENFVEIMQSHAFVVGVNLLKCCIVLMNTFSVRCGKISFEIGSISHFEVQSLMPRDFAILFSIIFTSENVIVICNRWQHTNRMF